MALKDKWIDKIDGVDDNSAEDINQVAHAVIELENKYDNDNGGGTSIDVTAEVGQTIIVKEVDANGKPTKWESADYQPRTHYETVLEETTVFEKSFTVDSGGMWTEMSAVSLTFGETYRITCNSVVYESVCFCAVYEGMNVNCVGNPAIFQAGDNNNIPFVFGHAPDVGLTAFGGIVGDVSLKVEHIVREYATLKQEYLPKGSQTYILTLPKGAFGEVPVWSEMHEITSIPYDDLADILWHGGDLLIDYSNCMNESLSGFSYRNKVSFWKYVEGEGLMVIIPVDVSRNASSNELNVDYTEIVFPIGTWTPPTV